MKSKAGRMVALAMALGACLSGTGCNNGASSAEVSEATTMMNGFEAEQRAAATARQKDATWKPACSEVGIIQVGAGTRPGALKNFCLNAEGNILACFAPEQAGPKNVPGIHVYSPKGELLKTMPLEIKPSAICAAKDGTIFVAGDGRLLKLNATGQVLASADSPVAKHAVTISKETEDMIRQMATQENRPVAEITSRMKTNLERRRADVTGVAVTEQDVFMAVPSPTDFTYQVYRFDQSLQHPTLVVEKLRGCCGQMDIQAHDGKLWIPHNARHAVECHDRDGKQLAKFGKAGRVKAPDFGGCCEPKNLRVLANGDVLAAESGPPTCIKRFSASGEFKEVVALADNLKGDCVRVTVEVSPDGRRYYMLDTTRDAIRVFAGKS